MKNIYTLRFIILNLFFITTIPVFSQATSKKDAQKAAQKFYFERIQNEKKINFSNVVFDDYYTKQFNNFNLYHIFTLKNGGYVIVSGSKKVPAVLAYSFYAPYNQNDMPENFKAWMAHYERQIVYAEQNDISPTTEVSVEWERLLNNNIDSFKDFSKQKSVLPLISSRWNQGNFYNGMCPQDPAGPGGRAYAGCVATAMGQLMFYHRWPISGVGSYAYQHPNYGTIEADFENTQYDWEGMANAITRPNKPIAQLLHHLGVAVDMNYGPNGSGMWNHSAARSMRNHFKYGPETQYIFRDSTTLTWDSILIANLDAKKPMYYAGWTQEPLDSSGHAFVCDGYQGFDFFHFDWGWGGAYNGYFYLNQLIPGGADFNFRQEVIKDIYPDTINYTYPLFCSGNKILTDIVGSIEDGSALLNYQNNTYCEWLIAPDLNVNNIKIQFNKLSTEQGADIIKIYNGQTTTSPLVGTYSGTNIPSEITVNGKKALVTFTANDSITSHGFGINYTTTLPIYCTALTTLTNPADTISDGSNQFSYNYLTNCRWRISPPNAQNITLTFTDFDVDENIDFVEIFDMTTAPATLIDSYTGNTLPPVKTYNSSVIMVWFKTNTFEPKSGWKLYYTSSATSVKTPQETFSFDVFPNPAQLTASINLKNFANDNISLQLRALNGQLLFQTQLNPNNNSNYSYIMDVSKYPSGMYFLNLNTQSASYFKKLIIY